MQKFKKDTVVRVAEDLGGDISHLSGKGKLAIVEHTYKEKYGSNDDKSYSLYFKDGGSSAWYRENQLTFVSSEGEGLISMWKEARETERKLNSEWERIYEESPEKLPNDTAVHLWEDVMKYGSIWGSRGEGFVALHNMNIVQHAYRLCKGEGYGKENLPYVVQEVTKASYEKW